ncbi:MAG TPA: lysylphosphatidylglycerol synthase transmembrane domain-containing protein [Cytophagales bacterium]|nr:lysylphosphatidylglycerol synthase transmembrane domain-containing protein [Cytophagales bacterium]
MNSNVKIALQYIISLAAAILLLWFLFQQIDPREILNRVQNANPLYIFISFILLIISHVSRAIRWKILIDPLGYRPSVLNSFLALMSGYFLNSLVPRLGEVTRCAVLQRTEKIPVTVSFGTVITERLVDLLMLMLLFVFTFILEFERLSDYFLGIFQEKFQNTESAYKFVIGFVSVALLILFSSVLIYRIWKEKLHQNKIFNKIFSFGKSIVDGMLSIRKVKARKAFVFHTIMIWAMYYFASFVVVYSLPQTSNLSFLAGFSILLMGSLGMTAPVQGGIGAFHYLVSGVLILYGIAKEDGVAFAFLIHTSQYVFTLVAGALCFIFTFIRKGKKTDLTYEYGNQNS